MTTKFQISDKQGDLIFVLATEEADPGVAYGNFAHALSLIGNQQAEATLARIEAVLTKGTPTFTSTVADPLAAAQATVQAAFPGAQPVQQEQWGNPPVPAFQRPAPQAPAAAAPVCQHGQKTIVSGTSKNPPYAEWKAWGCAARRDDPTKCKLEFIRDRG